MNVDVVEGDCVWLSSSSAHAPNLVAALIVVPVLVVSGVRHRERPMSVVEWVRRHVLEVFEAEFLGILYPAVYLSFESPVEDFVGCVIVEVLSDPFKALRDIEVGSIVVFVVSAAPSLVEGRIVLEPRPRFKAALSRLGESGALLVLLSR